MYTTGKAMDSDDESTKGTGKLNSREEFPGWKAKMQLTAMRKGVTDGNFANTLSHKYILGKRHMPALSDSGGSLFPNPEWRRENQRFFSEL